VTLPAFAAERRAAASLLLSAPAAGTPIAVDRYLLPAGRSAANAPAAAAAVDRWTDGQTDYRPFHRPAPHTMQAVSIARRRTENKSRYDSQNTVPAIVRGGSCEGRGKSVIRRICATGGF